MDQNTLEKLMLFPVDSPANRTPLPGSEEAVQMTALSGRKCSALLSKSNPLSLLLKTLLDSPVWTNQRVLLKWQTKRVPMFTLKRLQGESLKTWRESDINSQQPLEVNRSFVLFRLVQLERSTDENEFGLLLTPTAKESGIGLGHLVNKDGQAPKIGERCYDRNTGRNAQISVAQQILMLPTPTVNGNYNRVGVSKTSGNGLNTVVHSLIPTPTANDAGNSILRTAEMDRDGIPSMLLHLGMSAGTPIHPRFYELLMGYPEGWTDVTAE